MSTRYPTLWLQTRNAVRYATNIGLYLAVATSKTIYSMKNVVFWDIKTQFVRHRRHITSALQRPAG
jgi:hypothetical protein